VSLFLFSRKFKFYRISYRLGSEEMYNLMTSISIFASTEENFNKIKAIITDLEKNKKISPDAKKTLMEIAESSLNYIDKNPGLLEIFGYVVPTSPQQLKVQTLSSCQFQFSSFVC
jgi:hypothetical protein